MNESNKLDSSNYSNWKFNLQTQWEEQNAYAIESGDELKSTLATSGKTTTIHDWDKRENKEKVLLKLSVKYCIIPHIRECKAATDILTTLKDLYEIKNTNCLLFLKRKILSIKMVDNESIATFISCIKELKNKLDSIGETVQILIWSQLP